MTRLDPTKFKRDLTAHSVSFFALDQTVTVNDEMIDALILESAAAGNRPARICLHTMPDADFHEMVVLERPRVCRHLLPLVCKCAWVELRPRCYRVEDPEDVLQQKRLERMVGCSLSCADVLVLREQPPRVAEPPTCA